MRPDPVLQLLGLAQKAGFVKSGEFLTETTIKEGKSHLCIVAKDASENTRKKFSSMCGFHNVPYLEYSDKETIGHAIGKEFRASLSIVDAGLATQIQSKTAPNGGSDIWQK
ncbi:MAG: ribosomal L7Ae/L30e/S12e/Gadd45 family protein [Lachnospiraceae bacterium]|nr:ribosomal L7Ae/L30e/S12e/Gadd45 family protein [Lachnospiraceae bacterium]